MHPSSSAPPTHFLSQSRHTRALGPRPGDTYDVSTVAAADYDVDVRSGFMPPTEPVARLDGDFGIWEDVLDAALGRVKLASDLADASEDEKSFVGRWRDQVRQVRNDYQILVGCKFTISFTTVDAYDLCRFAV
jgi:indoleamine 2,3-dioxygenase